MGGCRNCVTEPRLQRDLAKQTSDERDSWRGRVRSVDSSQPCQKDKTIVCSYFISMLEQVSGGGARVQQAEAPRTTFTQNTFTRKTIFLAVVWGQSSSLSQISCQIISGRRITSPAAQHSFNWTGYKNFSVTHKLLSGVCDSRWFPRTPTAPIEKQDQSTQTFTGWKCAIVCSRPRRVSASAAVWHCKLDCKQQQRLLGPAEVSLPTGRLVGKTRYQGNLNMGILAAVNRPVSKERSSNETVVCVLWC